MKLSKQERIAALVIMAIIILALGGFLLVKPKFEEVGTTKTNLETKTKERDDAVAKQGKKAGLRDDILKTYEDGEHLADMFFPELTSYEADNAFREFITNCKSNVIVEQIEVSEPSTATLSASFYTPQSVEYALKTYATQGVEPTAEESEIAARQAALVSALMNSQTIGASTVSFTVSALTNEDLIKFADEVNNYYKDENGTSTRKAVALAGFNIAYDKGTYDRNVSTFYDKISENATNYMSEGGPGTEALNALRSGTGTGTAENNAAAAPSEGGAPAEPSGTPTVPENTPPAPSTGGDTGSENIGENITGGLSPDGADGDLGAADFYYTMDTELTFYSIERMQNPKAQLDAQDGIVNTEG